MLNSEITIKIDRKVVAGVFSLIFHFCLLLALTGIYQYQHSLDRVMEKTSPLVVESINQEALEELKQMRTVGIKNGKTGAMAIPEIVKKGAYAPAAAKKSIPTVANIPKPEQQARGEAEKAKNVAQKLAMLEKGDATQANKKLDLSSLSVPSKKESEKADYRTGKQLSLKSLNLKGTEITEFLKNDNLSAPMLNPMANPMLANSGIDVKMEVPAGVDVSELNEYELQFYSFQKRTAISYISSFYKTLDRFVMENPQIKFPLNSGKEVMTGRVTFDKDGNIKDIKMIRSSSNDKMQGFFENVLDGINRLPNPPKTLVKDAGQFSIFYTLVING